MMKNSESYYQLLNRYTPCGSQTLSKMANRYPSNYPKVLEYGNGGKVYDADGNCYIDFISGLGAVSVGYASDPIDNAIYKQSRKGIVFSLPSPLEYQAAKRLTELVPGTEMWKFGKNGTDGNVMAVRAARAITGRTKIMTVGYNGCADVFECRGVRTAGIPKGLAYQNIRAEYNDIDSFEALQSKEFACVLLEPMVFDEPMDDFLKWLRLICTDTDTLLIFDEVVNGGRFEGFTSANHFRVVPDMYVLGKGIANGLPLCAVGGPRSIMQVFERDDFFASGTFGGECLSLAAFLETSKILEEQIPKMIWNGNRIKEAFNKLFSIWDIHCTGYPTRLNFEFHSAKDRYLFWQEMCKNGVLVGYTNFIKAGNTDEEVNQIINAIFKSYKSIRDGAVLEGPLPTEVLKRG